MTQLSNALNQLVMSVGGNSSGGPPPVNRSTKPAPPGSLPTSTSAGQTSYDHKVKAGAIYAPGTYPTPELFPFPLGPHRILSEGPFTSSTIQSALDALSPSTTLYLPPRSKWTVTSAITLQPYQELATLGYPTSESEMALLEASEDCKPHMIHCWGKSGIRIRNIIFDGGREKYGHSKDCNVMLAIGHIAVNQVVDRCTIRHPRNWSCIQAFQGNNGVRITNNLIGPAGVGADIAKEEWADGISFGGTDGIVAGNLILDATDGAIVIFGAPGSLFTSNTIITRHRLTLGAINMVDYTPHNGNFEFTRVIHNTVVSEGSYIKMVYGQGWPCFSPNADGSRINRGGIVSHNLITSPQGSTGAVGFGFCVADVTNWTCMNNVVDPQVKFQGDISYSLPNVVVPPGPFVKDRTPEAQLGRLQDEFVSGRISFLIGIQPGMSTVLHWAPGGFRMQKGDKYEVEGIQLAFDGRLAIIEKRSGRRIWDMHSGYNVPGDAVTLDSDGRLLMTFAENSKHTLHDLIPHLPQLPSPGKDQKTSRLETTLILTSQAPYLQLTPTPNPHGITFYSATREFTIGNQFPVGHFALHPHSSGDSRLIMHVFSPYAQWVVLRSRIPGSRFGFDLGNEKSFFDLVKWGGNGTARLADNRWEVMWTSGNSPLQEPVLTGGNGAKLAFQGDGNLVIYAGKPVWSTGTHGRNPPAKLVRYGDGERSPWISLTTAEGVEVWKSN